MTLERRLATHCAPVMLGQKPATLFSLPDEDRRAQAMGKFARAYGLSVTTLCEACDKPLILVYAPAMLADALGQAAVQAALQALGYPMADGPERTIEHLRARMHSQSGFPHEIGFFLGYPAEDVLGFMAHDGKHCKACGLWKVYGDVPEAMALSARWRGCKRRVLDHLENGGTLYDLPTKRLASAASVQI